MSTLSARGRPPPYTPDAHHRRPVRLRTYDYTLTGAYFVTICVQGDARPFGTIQEDEVVLNDAGNMVQAVWGDIRSQYAGVQIDAFVVMPDHFHGVIVLCDGVPVGAAPVAALRPVSNRGE